MSALTKSSTDLRTARTQTSMICVSIGRGRHKHMIAEYHDLAERGVGLVELRLDFISRAVNLSRLLSDRPCPVIATCRRREDGGRWQRSEEDRRMLLRSAIASGVDYVDLEGDVASEIPRYGRTKRIVSYHNFDVTPADLEGLHKQLAAQDADVVKLATMANRIDDVLRMMDLVRGASIPTIGLCMGDIGTPTRLLAGRWGAPFTFATIRSGRKLAPGQLTWTEMRDLYRYDDIDGETELFGVIADPVTHSYSPLIHNMAFASQGLNCRYLPFQVPETDLETFIDACPAIGIRGLSVTIPHKEAVLPLLTRAEAAASGIGAVNTIVFDGNERLGYNTDYRAAMDSLLAAFKIPPETEQPFKGKHCLVLGAGGVARAVAWGLRQKGADVVITSRTRERADELARRVDGNAVDWEMRHEVRADVLVNGTPVGMHPDVDHSPFDGTRLNPQAVLFETIYNPEQTLLVKQAREAGCKVISGVDMFLRQAAYQYRLFTGQEPPVQVMLQCLKRATSAVKGLYETSPSEAPVENPA